jgi:hypothetical protein
MLIDTEANNLSDELLDIAESPPSDPQAMVAFCEGFMWPIRVAGAVLPDLCCDRSACISAGLGGSGPDALLPVSEEDRASPGCQLPTHPCNTYTGQTAKLMSILGSLSPATALTGAASYGLYKLVIFNHPGLVGPAAPAAPASIAMSRI